MDDMDIACVYSRPKVIIRISLSICGWLRSCEPTNPMRDYYGKNLYSVNLFFSFGAHSPF